MIITVNHDSDDSEHVLHGLAHGQNQEVQAGQWRESKCSSAKAFETSSFGEAEAAQSS